MLYKVKNLIIFCAILVLFTFCKNENQQTLNSAETIANIDTTVSLSNKNPDWITQFKQLRQAIYQSDTLVLKSFFDFPIIADSSNYIWMLAYNFNEKRIEELSADQVKPFTETDFMRYCKNLFPNTTKQSLLSIKSDSLAINKSAESYKEYTEKGYAYTASVSFDEDTQELSIGILSHGIQKDNFDGEGAIFYIFKWTKDARLKFNKVMLAG